MANTDEQIKAEAYEGLTANQQLNLFRNLYYNDGTQTERGVIANAINDILPKYNRQEAEIERLQSVIAAITKDRDIEHECHLRLLGELKTAKSEAIKECTKELKSIFGEWIFSYKTEDLFKKMAGESNG